MSRCARVAPRRRPQEDLAAGIEAALGFGGAIELGEFGLELCALGLEGFEGFGLALIDRGELGFNFCAGGHGSRPVQFKDL